MTLEAFISFASQLPASWSDYPFDQNTLTLKIGPKIFAITDTADFNAITLKCETDRILLLQASYEGVRPGYHMNKKHWITVVVNSDVSPTLIKDLIQNSYKLVFKSLNKNQKSLLQGIA